METSIPNGGDDSIRTELPDFPLADGLPGREGVAGARTRNALAGLAMRGGQSGPRSANDLRNGPII